VGQKYFKGERGKRTFGGAKYAKYNKINNKSKNFSEGKIAARGIFAPWLPLVAGLIGH